MCDRVFPHQAPAFSQDNVHCDGHVVAVRKALLENQSLPEVLDVLGGPLVHFQTLRHRSGRLSRLRTIAGESMAEHRQWMATAGQVDAQEFPCLQNILEKPGSYVVVIARRAYRSEEIESCKGGGSQGLRRLANGPEGITVCCQYRYLIEMSIMEGLRAAARTEGCSRPRMQRIEARGDTTNTGERQMKGWAQTLVGKLLQQHAHVLHCQAVILVHLIGAGNPLSPPLARMARQLEADTARSMTGTHSMQKVSHVLVGRTPVELLHPAVADERRIDSAKVVS